MQLGTLEEINAVFKEDYRSRRLMLIERAKVTLQAMLWSTEWLEQQGTLPQAMQAAQEGEQGLVVDPLTKLEEVFQVRLGDSPLSLPLPCPWATAIGSESITQ